METEITRLIICLKGGNLMHSLAPRKINDSTIEAFRRLQIYMTTSLETREKEKLSAPPITWFYQKEDGSIEWIVSLLEVAGMWYAEEKKTSDLEKIQAEMMEAMKAYFKSELKPESWRETGQ